MIRFYLNNQEVRVNVAPTITTTQDETLDSATVVLEANKNPNPIAPMQIFKIVLDSNNTLLFYTATDEVSIHSIVDKTYVHKLTITQNIRKLSKHLIRNTVFSQPPDDEIKMYCAIPFAYLLKPYPQEGYYFKRVGDTHGKIKWEEPLIIDDKNHIANVFLKVDTIIVKPTVDFDGSTRKGNLIKCNNPLKYFYNFIDENNVKCFRFNITKKETGEFITIYIRDKNVDLSNYFHNNHLSSFIEQQGVGEYVATIPDDEIFYNYEPDVQPILRENFVSFHIEIHGETYYYSAYDVLDTINKQYKQETKYYKKDDLFVLPTSGKLYDLLKSKIVPNMTFTQCTYFEAVAEVFKLFDAIFTLDENKVLGIEYLNELGSEITNAKYVGRTIALGEDKYNNGLVSYYQNALLKETYPAHSESNLTYAPARSVVLGVPEKENSFAFITPHNIEKILKVNIRVKNFNSLSGLEVHNYIKDQYIDLDITPFVFESSIWSLLNSTGDYPAKNILLFSIGDYSVKSQNAALTYTKGTNRINLSYFYMDFLSRQYISLGNVICSAMNRFWGFNRDTSEASDKPYQYQPKVPSANSNNVVWTDVRLSVEYLATLDGRVKVESVSNKYDGDILSNQANGGVDINKMGLNMLGLSYKLGEPILSMNQEQTTWANAIKKGQYFIDENGNQWVANVCTYTFYNDHISTNVQFIKNFNGLAQYIKVDRQKRLSNISSNLTLKAEDNYCEYLYISSVDSTEWGAPISICKNNIGIFANQIAGTFGENVARNIDYARLKTYIGTTELANVFLPIIKYGSGNALCFEMTMTDPISAGYQTTTRESGWFGSKSYFTKVVRYTNENGFFDICTISFISNNETYSFDNQFPDLSNVDILPIGEIENYHYYKKPNEIFALNYEIICLPLPTRINTDFINHNFVDNNGIIKGKNVGKFFIYFENDDFKYSISTQKGHGTGTQVISVDYEISPTENKFYIDFHIPIYITCKNWSICDENKNIYFASNTPKTNTTHIRLYFIPKHERL